MSFHPESNFADKFSRLSAMDRETKSPRFELVETALSYEFRCHIRAALKATIYDWRTIQFSWAESVEEKEKKVDLLKDTIHHIETRSGIFSRSFRLPEDAVVDEMTATVENGVLIVTIPKRRARAIEDRTSPEPRVRADHPPRHHVIDILA